MKIRILTIGSPKITFVKEAIAHFKIRLQKYVTVEIVSIPAEKITSHTPKEQLLEAEATKILKQIQHGEKMIVLDVLGKKQNSEQFSKLIERYQNQSAKSLLLVIGSPYGLSDSVKNKADFLLSLSDMTFSHETIVPVLLEQLYRAYAIIHHEPFVKY